MAPERRDDVIALGLRSIVSGTLDLPPRRDRRRVELKMLRSARWDRRHLRRAKAWRAIRRLLAPVRRPGSIQPELPTNRADLRGLDQPGMRDGNRVQRPFQRLEPEP